MVERRRGRPTSSVVVDNDSAASNNREVPSKEQKNDQFWQDIPGADVRVFTSDGKGIPAHSSVLASSSPVLDSLVQRRRLKPGRNNGVDKKGRPVASVVVPIHGVPRNAVVSFLRCLYSNAGFSRCPPLTDAPAATAAETTAEEVSKYGVHLLVLSHALQVPWLKRAAAAALAASLTVDNVIDMLQLARQCDAPSLHVHCMAMIRHDFKEVQQTEGWRFMQANDPWLELEVLERMEEDERRDARSRSGRREIGVYAELGDAVQCLEHICHDGCQLAGSRLRQGKDKPSSPCAWGDMCCGLQQLMLHFVACDRRKKLGAAAGCGRCKRMWQLLRLHSGVCDRDSCCKVPFCRQFKEKAEAHVTGNNKDVVTGAERWQLLARKVMPAKVILNVSKRTRDQLPPQELNHCETTVVSAPCT